MRYTFFWTCLASSLVLASDYSFDMDELSTIEVKKFDYNAYIKASHKDLNQKNNTTNYSKLESFLNYKYYQDSFTYEIAGNLYGEKFESTNSQNDLIINQLKITYKKDNHHSFFIGKNSNKWGKGYFVNPVAFIDKAKDPNDPEASRQGYIQAGYAYNKVLNGSLQNIALELIYLKTSENINNLFYNQDSNNIATKLYMLYSDIDIDFIYNHNDNLNDQIGVDFSMNLQTNFEIHGEYSNEFDSIQKYLFGFKYLTPNDLTITSEYYYKSLQTDKLLPLWDRRYLLNKLSLKEPLDMLYLHFTINTITT